MAKRQDITTKQEKLSNRITFTELYRLKQKGLEEMIIERGELFIIGARIVLKISEGELK